MNVTLLNGFYLATDTNVGGYSGSMTSEQQVNANIIRSFFLNEGWTINAICGMLGCIQGESTINPARIQGTHISLLPNSASSLSDVPNDVMMNFYKEYYGYTSRAFGVGLVQWDGYSDRLGYRAQKLVAYAIDNNINWWDGWTQMHRLRGEQEYDVNNSTTTFFYPVRYSGVTYTFENFPYSDATPEILASAWTSGYERNAGGVGVRDENARMWYNFFTGADAPAIIPPDEFLNPLPYDPDNPPFDPDDPDPVDPDVPVEGLPLWTLVPRKKKEMKRVWRTM